MLTWRPWRVTALALVVLAGCPADDEDLPVRPGGGGPGSGTEGDARTVDAGLDAAGGLELRGLVCVVADLRAPEACPAVATRQGVNVRVAGAGSLVTSDADGRYTLPIDATPVVIDTGDGASTLQPTRLRVASTGALVLTPVLTTTTWDAVVNATGAQPSDGSGAVVVYVDDASGPVAGVVFDAVAGAAVVPFYDGNGPLAWREAGGTGVAGVALLLDVPAGSLSISATAADQRALTLTGVPVAADKVTFVRARLP